MRHLLFALIAVPFLTACGQEKSHAVYDTDNNPDDFPPRAVEVISRIESGELSGAEAITQAFGDLLTEHGELLDRPEWRKTVDNLGGFFQRTGDSLAGRGLGFYSAAAEYYQLGLLARPEDTTLRRLSALFGCWQAAVRRGVIGPDGRMDGIGSLDGVCALAYDFASRGATARRFFLDHLAPVVRARTERDSLITPAALAERHPADHALLASVGLVDTTGLPRLIAFAESGIELIGARLTQLDSTIWRTEFYFFPQRSVADSLKVFLRLSTKGGGLHQKEFIPEPPIRSWIPGEVVLVGGTVEYADSLAYAAVGLCDFATPRPNFLKPVNWRTDLFLVPEPNIIRR